MSNRFTREERLLLPPTYTGIDESLPLAFVAGPIQGAPDYQTILANRIIDQTKNVFVASPRRLEMTSDFDYDKQVWWEQANLGRAAFNGVMIFWLEPRDPSLPYTHGRPYAKTTFGEINFALGRKAERQSTNIHIGIHPEYTPSGGISEKYIRSMAKLANLHIYDSIKEVESAALEDLTKLDF